MNIMDNTKRNYNIIDNTKRNYNETIRQHVWNGKKQQALYVDAFLALVKGTRPSRG
jgi:hypothetical protein